MTVRLCEDQREWDETVRHLDGHPLQLWGWGELKSAHNWRAYRLVVEEQGRVVGGAQVLQRKLPWPFRSLLYVPRGPVGDFATTLSQLTDYLKNRMKATHIAIEPHQIEKVQQSGWRKVEKAILLPRTIILDLSLSEDKLLADMNKKTRQYIRKSANNGVKVRTAGDDDLESCLVIYRETAERANFGLHSDRYYRNLHKEMGESSKIFVAEYEGKIVAFLWLVATPAVAFELYGGVNQIGQNVRANYILKWQAVQNMQKSEVGQYDMNGLLNDGVSTFKKSFTTEETMLAGTYEYALSIWYQPWKVIFPMIKKIAQTIALMRK